MASSMSFVSAESIVKMGMPRRSGASRPRRGQSWRCRRRGPPPAPPAGTLADAAAIQDGLGALGRIVGGTEFLDNGGAVVAVAVAAVGDEEADLVTQVHASPCLASRNFTSRQPSGSTAMRPSSDRQTVPAKRLFGTVTSTTSPSEEPSTRGWSNSLTLILSLGIAPCSARPGMKMSPSPSSRLAKPKRAASLTSVQGIVLGLQHSHRSQSRAHRCRCASTARRWRP